MSRPSREKVQASVRKLPRSRVVFPSGEIKCSPMSLYSIHSPVGDKVGTLPFVPPSSAFKTTGSACPEDFTFMRLALPFSIRIYTIQLPSGDHAGATSLRPLSLVTGIGVPPEAEENQMCTVDEPAVSECPIRP